MLRARLAQAFLDHDRDHWAEVFAEVDACVTPVLSMTEAPGHEHLAARSTFVELGGGVQPAPAPRFSRTAPVAPPPPPLVTDAGSVLDDWEA